MLTSWVSLYEARSSFNVSTGFLPSFQLIPRFSWIGFTFLRLDQVLMSFYCFFLPSLQLIYRFLWIGFTFFETRSSYDEFLLFFLPAFQLIPRFSWIGFTFLRLDQVLTSFYWLFTELSINY